MGCGIAVQTKTEDGSLGFKVKGCCFGKEKGKEKRSLIAGKMPKRIGGERIEKVRRKGKEKLGAYDSRCDA